ncbi:MAG: hypothetical protein WAO00_14285, partial [Chthoniobacterales bacterium]
MRLIKWTLLLLAALALVIPTPTAWGQEGEPIPEEELPAFLGSVQPAQFAWHVLHCIDFDVYYGKPNPPLVGSTGFYLGFAPQDLEPGHSTIISRLGRFRAKWHRNVGPDGSIRQEAIIALGGVLDMKAHVWAEAPNEDQLQKLLSVLGQLPIFSSGWIPTRFRSLQDDVAEEQRVRRIIWVCWSALIIVGAGLLDRFCRRRQSSAAFRLLTFAGVIAFTIAATISGVAMSPPFVIDRFVRANMIFLLVAAGAVCAVALLLSFGLSLVRLFRT